MGVHTIHTHRCAYIQKMFIFIIVTLGQLPIFITENYQNFVSKYLNHFNATNIYMVLEPIF